MTKRRCMKTFIIGMMSLIILSACAPTAELKYTGEGEGYAGVIVAEVTMQGSKIIGISILESSDTPGLSTQAFEVMIERILEKQTVEVDVVSGATGSSRGLIEAVSEAIAKAK
jgi:uncharacterized protein with FMN-binding domain